MTTTTESLSFITNNLRPEIQRLITSSKFPCQQFYIVSRALIIIGGYSSGPNKFCAISCMPDKPKFGDFPLNDFYLDATYAEMLESLLYDLQIIFEHKVFDEFDALKLEPFFTTVNPEIAEHFKNNTLFGHL